MAMDVLPPLREVIQSYSLSAKKSFGQNFLLNLNVTDKIARHAGAQFGGNFIEIGPGPGGLTRSLLSQGADHVTVIEKDSRCLAPLQDIARCYPDRLEIIHDDILSVNMHALYPSGYHIVGNLPYNISTPILIDLLTASNWPPKWQKATFMFQKEFADRLIARENSRNYSRLSVLAATRVDIQRCFNLAPSNFTPPPKVFSSLMQFIPHHHYPDINVKTIEQLTHHAFSQKRKMIRQSLKGVFSNAEDQCLACGIDPTKRADHLSVAEYITLSQFI